MISIKIVDENREEFFSLKINSEKLQNCSIIANAITDALPHLNNSIPLPFDGDLIGIAPIIATLISKGISGSCVFMVDRKTWETEIKPIIEPLIRN